MDPLVALYAFAVIFPAELPDKSMLTAIVLGSRYRSLPVWIGLATAFLVHVIIATTAGNLLTLLPEVVVTAIVTAFFLGFGLVLLLRSGDDADESEVKVAAGPLPTHRIVLTAFLAVFITEWGDLTQLATINLTARYDDPLSVGIGAIAALWLVTGLGVLLGRKLLQRLPLRRVKQVAGIVLLLLAVWSAVDLLRLL